MLRNDENVKNTQQRDVLTQCSALATFMNIYLLGGNNNLWFYNFYFQVDGKKVPRDGAHPHFPFNIPF